MFITAVEGHYPLARQFLIARWRFMETGVHPAGVLLLGGSVRLDRASGRAGSVEIAGLAAVAVHRRGSHTHPPVRAVGGWRRDRAHFSRKPCLARVHIGYFGASCTRSPVRELLV